MKSKENKQGNRWLPLGETGLRPALSGAGYGETTPDNVLFSSSDDNSKRKVQGQRR
ncbi:MAG: hypothetical protein R3C44_20565 [Chloroflexota bacterium]